TLPGAVADNGRILEPAALKRYADAIVKASLGVTKGDTLVVQAEPAHREFAVEVVAAGYRAGAELVDLQYYDPLVSRARLLNGNDAALGVVSPWSKTRMKELMKPTGPAPRSSASPSPAISTGSLRRRSAPTTRAPPRARTPSGARTSTCGRAGP